MTDIEEDRVVALAAGLESITSEQARNLVDFIQKEIGRIVAACRQC
jgi:hypothetical protein